MNELHAMFRKTCNKDHVNSSFFQPSFVFHYSLALLVQCIMSDRIENAGAYSHHLYCAHRKKIMFWYVQSRFNVAWILVMTRVTHYVCFSRPHR